MTSLLAKRGTDRTRPGERPGRASYGTRKLAPVVEACERRTMLSGDVAAGVIAGTAFVDRNGDGGFDPADVPLSGATVQLYRASDSPTLVASTQTDARGAYKFEGLAPGDYLVRECPPAGYANTGTESNAQLDPGTEVSPSTIKVTVVPRDSVFVNYNGVDPDRSAVGSFWVVNGFRDNAFGPMRLSLGTSAGRNDLNPGYLSLCLDDLQTVSYGGGESYQVGPRSIAALTGNPATGGRVAYLFNHYGNGSLTNVTGPALQLAVWELVYDGGAAPDFAEGNFQVAGPIAGTGGATQADILAQATAFYNESLGKNEPAVFLRTATDATEGQQSMIATGSYNFANNPALCRGLTATIGFWNNKNGQALIRSLNGGPASTALATWLSATYPNLYGPGTGGATNPNDLTGKTNADVAALFQKFFIQRGNKADAQTLAVALAQYATTSSLGGTAAVGYGFRVTAAGLGSVRVSVGSAGAAFGVPNGSSLTVSQLLQAANSRSRNGRLYDGNAGLVTTASSLFDWINQTGDI